MNDVYFGGLRKAMVDSQLRPNKVIDERVIAAFSSVPRELFVTKPVQKIAYIDEDIPLSGGRCLMEAMVMARLIQALALQSFESVMIIGAATGYSAALISSMVDSVIAIETRENMVQKAQENVASLGIGNVAVIKGRLQDGYPSASPYDAIFIEGAVEAMPQALFDQLGKTGRLAAILRPCDEGGMGVGDACIWHKTGADISCLPLFNAQTPVMDEFKAKPKFNF